MQIEFSLLLPIIVIVFETTSSALASEQQQDKEEQQQQPPPLVEISSGALQGEWRETFSGLVDYASFTGIPYGKAPVT